MHLSRLTSTKTLKLPTWPSVRLPTQVQSFSQNTEASTATSDCTTFMKWDTDCVNIKCVLGMNHMTSIFNPVFFPFYYLCSNGRVFTHDWHVIDHT